MHTVYIEKDIFEEVCMFDDYPNWKQVIASHANVCINIEEDLLDKEIFNPESPIFLFLNAYVGAKIPIALKDYFDLINEDISVVLNHPMSSFILEVSEDKANKIRNEYGIAVFSISNLFDDYFSQGFFKEIKKDSRIIDGWKSLINIELPVSNALVISDNYLFENEERGINLGMANIPKLLDVFLPANLSIDFHLLIIAKDGGKSRDWWVKKVGALKTDINNLRSYNINLELVLTKAIHKRRIMSNYLNGWADNGFSVFRSYDSELVRMDNDIHLYRIFNNLNSSGDSHFQSLKRGLEDLKVICNNVSSFIVNHGESSDYRIFGDCNKDKTIKNRLLS